MGRWWLSLFLSVTARGSPPEFHRDVLPILQRHCQICHRRGEIGPMPLTTFREARPWAKAIRDAVVARKMPPWFADPCCGKFANDPSLAREEIETIRAWAEAGAPEGNPKDAPPPRVWPEGWRIGRPDAVLAMARPFPVPAGATLAYQYFILPTGIAEDRWIQAVEVRPSNRALVHHAVVYVREPGSTWLTDSRPPGVTTSDILMVYTPGNAADSWPSGFAKKIPAGSDLVLQIHYTAGRQASEDLTRAGLVFAKNPPSKRVHTLQMGNDRFVIPPGDPNYRAQISGTLPNDALLLSLLPHMHLRGKAFEFLLAGPEGRWETLLDVRRYDFFWQLQYKLAQPRPLKAGTRLLWTGYFDNSRNNPRNPDPTAEVRFGEQSWEEMMIGFFDVAVDAGVDKATFFRR